jgi:hypothetical protein
MEETLTFAVINKKQKLTTNYINFFNLLSIMEDTKGKILQFIQGKGPVLPADIARHISSNILIASAHLSELSSNGKLKISNVKVGGSPLYYIPGQESQLQNFADNLHEKEKKAYDLLLQKKILNDGHSEPVIRVALRAIKDYAVPLQVNFKGGSEIFWRWYLLTNKEAEELIRETIKETQPPIKTQTPQEQPSPEKIEEKQVKKTIEKPTNQEIQKKIQPLSEKTKPETPNPETKKLQDKKKKPVKTDHNEFLNTISNYFNRNKINTLSKEIIRKTEIDFIVQVPSAVGNLEYYCKAKNKKKINDADLASAFAQGQLRKLPVLIITNGELTKRAKEMLQKDFKGIGIKHI